MLSHTINDRILGLFEESSHGLVPLLSALKALFQCTSLTILFEESSLHAANDMQPLDTEHLFRLENSHTLILALQEAPISLRFIFQTSAQLTQCIHSDDVVTLIPYIQQAVLIAHKISEQQSDLASIDYVMTHHPCQALPQTPRPYTVCEFKGKRAANHAYYIHIERSSLQSLFGLTLSEAELGTLLFNGLNLQQIAEHRRVSKQTIRKQLQAILKKTQCDSQEAFLLLTFELLLTRLHASKKDGSND